MTGPPTSSNAASSFHLNWELQPQPLTEVSAVIEILDAPSVPKLYFWALQASFMRGPARIGGAHFGLQFHPSYPANGAVNWGGYADRGGELDGSVSPLPSALNNINTRDYRWQPGRPYRYRIYQAPNGQGWRGSITDMDAGVETIVRDLAVDADSLSAPVVWSEVFADCDEPSVAIRWSELQGVTQLGTTLTVADVRLNYQTYGDGGCGNTNTARESGGFVQRTNVERTNPTGTRLSL